MYTKVAEENSAELAQELFSPFIPWKRVGASDEPENYFWEFEAERNDEALLCMGMSLELI